MLLLTHACVYPFKCSQLFAPINPCLDLYICLSILKPWELFEYVCVCAYMHSFTIVSTNPSTFAPVRCKTISINSSAIVAIHSSLLSCIHMSLCFQTMPPLCSCVCVHSFLCYFLASIYLCLCLCDSKPWKNCVGVDKCLYPLIFLFTSIHLCLYASVCPFVLKTYQL